MSPGRWGRRTRAPRGKQLGAESWSRKGKSNQVKEGRAGESRNGRRKRGRAAEEGECQRKRKMEENRDGEGEETGGKEKDSGAVGTRLPRLPPRSHTRARGAASAETSLSAAARRTPGRGLDPSNAGPDPSSAGHARSRGSRVPAPRAATPARPRSRSGHARWVAPLGAASNAWSRKL